MKKLLIGLITLMLVLSCGGCGAKEQVEEKIAEKIIEYAGGGDVDIDGDKVTVKGEDGTEAVFGESEWPTSDLAKKIPVLSEGKVTLVMESGDTLLINMEEVPEEDFANYLEEIKKTYTENAYEQKAEDQIAYGAESGDGFGVSIYYMSDATFSITVAPIPE